MTLTKQARGDIEELAERRTFIGRPESVVRERASSVEMLARRLVEIQRAVRAGDQHAARYELQELRAEADRLASRDVIA